MSGMNLTLKPDLGGGVGNHYGIAGFGISDEYTTARSAGAVNGTACEPGVDTRTIVDTEGKITIADGKLVCAGGAATPVSGDPGDWLTTAITRAPGVIGACKIIPVDVSTSVMFGFDTNKSGVIGGNAFYLIADAIRLYSSATSGPTILIPIDNAETTMAVILRADGAFFFIKLSTGYWKLVGATNTNNIAALYLGIAVKSMAFTKDWMRKAFLKWLPTPVISDGFTAADATSNDGRLSDGLGHAEGVAGGIGSGGGGVAWSGSSGAIQLNRLVITPGLEHNAVTVSNADVTVETAFSRASGAIGVVIGLDSVATPLNFIRAKHDGTNIILEIYQAGTPTTKATVAATYGADYVLTVRRDGTEIWVYYNKVLIGTGPTTTLSAGENANLRGAKAGLFSTSPENSFNYCTINFTGTNGEYSVLDGIIGV